MFLKYISLKRGCLSLENEVIEVIEKYRTDVEIESNKLTIKLKFNPISKKDKELIDVLNYVINQKYILEFGGNDYQCYKFQSYYKGNDRFERFYNKYFNNTIELHAVALLKTNADINTNSVDIKKANQINIYAETINSINAKKFIYEEELNDISNVDLMIAVNNIQNTLNNQMAPTHEDLSVLKRFAKSSSSIASFASDIITILGVFLK